MRCPTPKRSMMLLVFVLTIGLLAVFASGMSSHYTTAQAASYPSQVSISWDHWSEYGATAHNYGSIPVFSLNSGAGVAHCVVPSATVPAAGSYSTSQIRCATGAPDRTSELIAYLYYGWEGPGFDASMWPSSYFNGQAWTADLYYGMTHVLVSYAFTGSVSEACLGCSSELTAWIERNIIGVSGSTTYSDAVGQQIAARASRVPNAFEAFLIDSSGGGEHQTLVGYLFTPITLTTSAAVQKTGSKMGYVTDNLTITDVVSYTGLNSDASYRLSMSVVDAAGGGLITDAQGNEVSCEYTFTPQDMNGTFTATVSFDASHLAGHTLVVYQSLYDSGGNLLAAHHNINDAQQSIYLPSIITQARGGNSNINEELNSTDTLLIDQVSYTNLEVGGEYRIVASLYSPQNDALLVDDEEVPISAEVVFIAEDTAGVQEIEIVFDASALAGQDVVVFEQLYKDDLLLAEHTDTLATEQTISFPSMNTAARSEQTGIQLTDAALETTIIDTVSYENLTPDATYVLVSEVVYAEGGEAVLDVENEPICVVTELIPEETSGQVEVYLEVPAKHSSGQAVTVFQRLYRDESLVAEHAEINDENQTIYLVELATSAHNGSNGKEVPAQEHATIVDNVSYKGLIAGETYRLESTLVSVSTGATLLYEDGMPLSVQTEFTPESSDGTVDITFTLDTSTYANQELVCFERLYKDDILIASHADLYDEAQTILCTEVAKTLPSTGQGSWMVIAGSVAVLMVGLALRFAWRVWRIRY